MVAEAAFPRGRIAVDSKQNKKKTEEKKKKRNKDFLFGGSSAEEAEKPKRQKRETTAVSKSLLPIGGGAVNHKPGTAGWIEPLSFNKLNVGMKMLGVCRQVHESMAIFSLPNMWTGYMLRDNSKNEPPLDSCLSVNQVICVVIVKVASESAKGGPKRRIQVTVSPDKINGSDIQIADLKVRGRVVSVEDHGVLVDLGLKRRGFLAFSDIQGEYSTEEDEQRTHVYKLALNRILDVLVKSKSDTPIIPLKLPKEMAKVTLPTLYKPTLYDLQPGTLIDSVTFEQTLRNGLAVTFGMFRGAIEYFHLGSFWKSETKQENTNWKDVFAKHPSFSARILAVDPKTKIIRLTLLPHLLSLKAPPMDQLPMVGEVVQGCTVLRLDVGLGALLAFPSTDNDEEDEQEEDEPVFPPLTKEKKYLEATRVKAVYVHISKAKDDEWVEDGKLPEAIFTKQFAPSTKHAVRILSTANLIEGVASGGTAPGILNAHVLTHADLKPGQLYKQVPVYAVSDGGNILVDFGMGIRGMIPSDHLFDQSVESEFRIKVRKTKYSVGARNDVRVLTVDETTKRCLVTAKRSLVKANNDEIMTSYQDAKVGQKAVGFVSKLDDDVLFVTFFNGVYGRVTKRSLAVELGVENHRESYNHGDVVHCRVVNVKKRSKRRSRFDDDDDEETGQNRFYHEILLSLRTDSQNEDDEMVTESPVKDQPMNKVLLQPGTILPLKSLRVVEFCAGKQKPKGFVPGHAIVSIKSKYMVGDADAATMPPYIECKLPYDQLLDRFDSEDIESAETLDQLAESMLTIGKKINRKGFVMTDPKKLNSEYASATGELAVVSIRPLLVEVLEGQRTNGELREEEASLPGPHSHFFAGALVIGYVIQLDQRHGAFVRFLGGMTGLVPKLKGGLHLKLFSTVVLKIIAVDDTHRPPKILLGLTKVDGGKRDADSSQPVQPGSTIEQAEIEKLDFHRAFLKVLDDEWPHRNNMSVRLHCAWMEPSDRNKSEKSPSKDWTEGITPSHPFCGFSKGDIITDLKVVTVEKRTSKWVIEVSNRSSSETLALNAEKLTAGSKVSGIITTVVKNQGVWLQLGPSCSGHAPSLELSEDIDVLNNLSKHFPVGKMLSCVVMKKNSRRKPHSEQVAQADKKDILLLSLLGADEKDDSGRKPKRGDLIVGRINRSLSTSSQPNLMLNLRGGFIGKCCITELEEVDDWKDFPLGRPEDEPEDEDKMEIDEDEQKRDNSKRSSADTYAHGKYVQCRVLAGTPSKPMVEVSLRPSRLEGDLDDDEPPEVGETVQAYVTDTTKKGCFLRLARQIEGRTILKELCDGFLPNPVASFPPGRLVAGKIKKLEPCPKKRHGVKWNVDVDMRESKLVEDFQDRLGFEDVEIGSKYKGTVTRIEEFGVFVRLEKSDVTGLVHKSECSDKFVKNVADLFQVGDLVKLLVLKKNAEKKQVGFSMKASHFEGDEDSEDDDSIANDIVDMADDEPDDKMRGIEELDSDDENFGAKLAAKMNDEPGLGLKDGGGAEASDDDSSSEDGDGSEDFDDDDDDDDDNNEKEALPQQDVLDTNVGFDWSTGNAKERAKVVDHDSDSSEDEDDEDVTAKSSNKSRKKQAERKREEQEIARREAALADGTADENPETAADFERLLASSPNSSEIWILYMAFYLTLANVPAAREIANRAFARIEFREEREKLNVWCALLTLELKFGSDEALQETLDRACQHNNPKHVYLRVCEMMEKQEHSKTAEMFEKMCKRFRDKKSVWIAYMEYLLKNKHNEEAQNISKRALLSLKPYKHVETMTKFAIFMFQYGNVDKARTIFEGLLVKYPKRLDLLFVYLDKEVKHGEIARARSIYTRVPNPNDDTLRMKLNDKQMKKFFKKWYHFEEQHGTEESQENVKDAARRYVEQS